MRFSCCVTRFTFNYSKKEVKSQNLTVFKFPNKDEWRQKWLWNIPRKF